MKNIKQNITANSYTFNGEYINVIPEGVSGRNKYARSAIKSTIHSSLKDITMSVKTSRQLREENIGNDFAQKILDDYDSPDSAYKINLIVGWPGSAKTSNVNKYGIKALVKNGIRLFVMAVPQTTISQQTYQSLAKIVSGNGPVSQACGELGIGCQSLTGEQFKVSSTIPQGGATTSKVYVVITTVQFVHNNVKLFTTSHQSPAINNMKAVIFIDEGHIGVGNSTPENSITNKGHGYGEGKWAETFKKIVDSAPSLWRLYAMTASPTPSQQNYSTVDKMTPRLFIDMDKTYRTRMDYTAYEFIFIGEDDVNVAGKKTKKSMIKKKISEMIYERSMAITKERANDGYRLFSLVSEDGKKWLTDSGNEATDNMPNHLDGYCAPHTLAIIGALGRNGNYPANSICYPEAAALFQNNVDMSNIDYSVTYDKHLYSRTSNGITVNGDSPYEVYEHMRNNYHIPRIHHTYSMGLVGLNVPSIRVIAWTRHPSQDVDAGPLTNGMGRGSRLNCGKFSNSEELIKALWNSDLSESDKQAIHDYILYINVTVYIMPDYRLISGDMEFRDSECNTKPFPSKTVIEHMKEICFSKDEFYASADTWKNEVQIQQEIERLTKNVIKRVKQEKGRWCTGCPQVEWLGEKIPHCFEGLLKKAVSCKDFQNWEEECYRIVLGEYEKYNKMLHTHHVDVDLTNNSPENLQTLCPNAHSAVTNEGNHTAKRYS